MLSTTKDGPAELALAPSEERKAPPLRRTHRAAEPSPQSKLMAARRAVQNFLADEFQAREVRITKVAPSPDSPDAWSVEAEILVPDLGIKTLGLPLTQEVLEKEYCTIELAPDMTVKSYEVVDPLDR